MIDHYTMLLIVTFLSGMIGTFTGVLLGKTLIDIYDKDEYGQ